MRRIDFKKTSPFETASPFSLWKNGLYKFFVSTANESRVTNCIDGAGARTTPSRNV